MKSFFTLLSRASHLVSVLFLMACCLNSRAATTFTLPSSATFSAGSEVITFLVVATSTADMGPPYTINIPPGITLTIGNDAIFDLTAFNATINITGGTLNFDNNNSILLMSSSSVINWLSGNINTASNGSNVFIVIGTCSSPFNCQYTGNELMSSSSLRPIKLTQNGFVALPVELTRFHVTCAGNRVSLAWATASEQGNRGFEVQRSADGSRFEPLGWVDGNGTTLLAHEYSFEDDKPLPGPNYYRLRQEDWDGGESFSQVQVAVMKLADLPGGFSLRQLADELVLTRPASAGGEGIALSLFDLNGRLLHGKALSPDDEAASLDLSGLPSGIYLFSLEWAGQRHSIKICRTGR